MHGASSATKSANSHLACLSVSAFTCASHHACNSTKCSTWLGDSCAMRETVGSWPDLQGFAQSASAGFEHSASVGFELSASVGFVNSASVGFLHSDSAGVCSDGSGWVFGSG